MFGPAISFDRMYLLAETDHERMAVAHASANALWRALHRDDTMPTIEFLDQYLQPFITKEILVRALAEHRKIESDIMTKRAHAMAHDIMTANAEIERKLKMEHLDKLAPPPGSASDDSKTGGQL